MPSKVLTVIKPEAQSPTRLAIVLTTDSAIFSQLI